MIENKTNFIIPKKRYTQFRIYIMNFKLYSHKIRIIAQFKDKATYPRINLNRKNYVLKIARQNNNKKIEIFCAYKTL